MTKRKPTASSTERRTRPYQSEAQTAEDMGAEDMGVEAETVEDVAPEPQDDTAGTTPSPTLHYQKPFRTEGMRVLDNTGRVVTMCVQNVPDTVREETAQMIADALNTR